MRNPLFWGFTRRRMVIPYRCFGTNISNTAWSLKMGLIGCPKISVRNYHLPCVNPQKSANLILIPHHTVCLQHEESNEKLIRIAEISGGDRNSNCFLGFMDAYLYEWRQPPTPCADSKPIQPLFLLWWDKLPQTPLEFVQNIARERVQKLRPAVSDWSSRPKFNGLKKIRLPCNVLWIRNWNMQAGRRKDNEMQTHAVSSLVLFGVASQSTMNLISYSNMRQVRSVFGYVKWGINLNEDLSNIKLV